MAHYLNLSKSHKASVTYIILFFFTLNYIRKNLFLVKKLIDKSKIINKLTAVLYIFYILYYFLKKLQNYFFFPKIFVFVQFIQQKSIYSIQFIIIHFGYCCYEIVSFPIISIFTKIGKLTILINLNNFLTPHIVSIYENFLNLKSFWLIQFLFQICVNKVYVEYMFSKFLFGLASVLHVILLFLVYPLVLLVKDFRESLFETWRIFLQNLKNFNFKNFINNFFKFQNHIETEFSKQKTFMEKIRYILLVFFYIMMGLVSIFECFHFIKKNFCNN